MMTMSTRFTLSLAVVAACSVLTATAQNRDLRTQKLVLDDNNNNIVTIQTPTGPITGGTLTIPDPAGAGQFLISTPSGGTQSVSGHLLPGTDNLYDLGSGTFRWRHLFLSGNLQLGSGLRITEPGGTDYTEFVAQAQANNITYTLPAANGSAGQVLRIASSPAPTATAATLEWGASSGWNLTGNTGTTAGTNFVGTTDNQAFEIHVDEAGTATEGRRRVMRFEPNATSANIIGGFNGNSVTSGVIGATVSGGGSTGNVNSVTDDYGVVGGGQNNRAGDNAGTTSDQRYATVGGGRDNTASNSYSTVSGGNANTASESYSTVGGGVTNTASENYSTVGGGANNTASGSTSTVGGGELNTASQIYSTVGGGRSNTAAGDYSAIPGGRGLTLSAARSFGFLGGNTGSNDMTISDANVAVFGNTDLWLANNDNAPSELRFFEAETGTGAFPSGTNYTAFKAASVQTGDITYTLPAAAPSTDERLLLSTSGGTLSWGRRMIKVTVNQNIASVAANASSVETFTVAGAPTSSSVIVSPQNALTDGLIISYARVSASGTVEVKFRNETGAAIDEAAMDFYITVID
ncbi:MAG: hypothetical protein IPM61_00380 [Chlorobi bacterium]|nr:hypothetical protein [Chlorobiota bacterium]